MNSVVTIIAAANSVANGLGGVLLQPVALVPGWLSLTVISAVLGILLLLIFKYTSRQQAIARVRNGIKADLLAVKLFKESLSVTFRLQAGVFAGSFKLLAHSIVPMLVMVLPVSLILAQLGMWYQARPLRLDDQPVLVKLTLNGNSQALQQVRLEALPAAEITAGPARVLSKNEVYWKIKPLRAGYHTLRFHVGGRAVDKQLAIGEGFMRISPVRPGPAPADMFLYPLEKPFAPDSPVHAISIEYPARASRIYGTDWWIAYFLVVSIISAFIGKPFFNVRI